MLYLDERFSALIRISSKINPLVTKLRQDEPLMPVASWSACIAPSCGVNIMHSSGTVSRLILNCFSAIKGSIHFKTLIMQFSCFVVIMLITVYLRQVKEWHAMLKCTLSCLCMTRLICRPCLGLFNDPPSFRSIRYIIPNSSDNSPTFKMLQPVFARLETHYSTSTKIIPYLNVLIPHKGLLDTYNGST